VALLLVAIYILIPAVIGVLPWTRAFADRLREAFLEPVRVLGSAFVGYVPNLFFLLVIGAATHHGLAIVRLLFDEVGRGALAFRNFDREWAEPRYKIARTLRLAFAVVVAFPYLPGAGSDAFKGVSLFFGVLLSLGSSAAVANIVSGVILTYTRAFRLGDRVRIGDTEGDVIATTLLETRLRTITQVEATIPNVLALSSHIDNFRTAARATPDIEREPAPFVLKTSLDDFYVSYQLNAYTRARNVKQRTYAALHENIQDASRDAKVEIMSPHYRALRDGDPTTIPAAPPADA
jgi:small-conductance mechanosensitive channel